MSHKNSAIFMLLYSLWCDAQHMRVRLVFSAVFTLGMVMLNVSLPLCFKTLIEFLSCNHHTTFANIYFVLAGYGILWVINQSITHVRTLVVLQVLEQSSRILSLKLFRQLLELPVRFHLDKQTGSIISAIERAQNGLDAVFWGIVTFLLPTLLEALVVVFTVSYFYGIYYGFSAIILAIAYTGVNGLLMNKVIEAQELYSQKRSEASGRIVDSLLNIETIKYFNARVFEQAKINNLLRDQEKAGIKRSILEARLQLGQMVVIGLTLTAITLKAGLAVYSNNLTVADFVLINSYLLQFFLPLNHFNYVVQQVRKGLQDLRAAFDLLALKPEIQDTPHALTFGDTKNTTFTCAHVEFNRVSFGYTPKRTIVHDISFVIPAGKTVALVGSSGSGKSTIARLLVRFYDVTSGSIRINSHDIKNISQASLRDIIGVVPQDVVLFNDTLYNNIAYGRPNASLEEVQEAAEQAQLTKFINLLPEGYTTLVGERGLKLSGGEKQRVGLARVLLKKPKILIFDEATSSLDTYTEREVQKNICAVSQNITTLIIAHRLSTIIHADEIIVLEQGKIVERGTHTELINYNGLYAHQLHSAQV